MKSITRRELALGGLTVAGATLLGVASGANKFQLGQKIVAVPKLGSDRGFELKPTLSCGDGGSTPWVSEGPFYAPASPERADFRTDHGVEIVLQGLVVNQQCEPISGAVVDFWQTDPGGRYDHFGYDFRGHQFTDRNGAYELFSVLPVSYVFLGVSRRRHIHVKLAAPGYRPLTTQIFFPFGVDVGVEDFSFDPKLVCSANDNPEKLVKAQFHFVMQAA